MKIINLISFVVIFNFSKIKENMLLFQIINVDNVILLACLTLHCYQMFNITFRQNNVVKLIRDRVFFLVVYVCVLFLFSKINIFEESKIFEELCISSIIFMAIIVLQLLVITYFRKRKTSNYSRQFFNRRTLILTITAFIILRYIFMHFIYLEGYFFISIITPLLAILFSYIPHNFVDVINYNKIYALILTLLFLIAGIFNLPVAVQNKILLLLVLFAYCATLYTIFCYLLFREENKIYKIPYFKSLVKVILYGTVCYLFCVYLNVTMFTSFKIIIGTIIFFIAGHFTGNYFVREHNLSWGEFFNELGYIHMDLDK